MWFGLYAGFRLTGTTMSKKTFGSWGDIPEYLMTKTALGRAGLKLAPGQEPVAQKTGGRGPYDLYDRRTAVPKRAMSAAQKTAAAANLEKARAARYCVDCGDCGVRLDGNGRCALCGRIRKRRTEARDELRALAAADDWVVVDTETTGLGDKAQVVQIGIVDAAGNELFNQLVRPSVAIEPEATRVHGLTAAKLAGCPAWPEVWPAAAALINGRVLAYNAAFDGRVIAQSCRAYGLPEPVLAWVDVMGLVAAAYGMWSNYHEDFRWFSLGEAAAIRGIRPYDDDRYKPHDAAGDAWLTWRLVKLYKKQKA